MHNIKKAQGIIEYKALKQEYDILKLIDSDLVLKAKSFTGDKEQCSLEYVELQGQSLSYPILNEYNLQDKIKIFAQMANALSIIHEKNVLHKNLRPDQFIFDATTKKITIVGFDIASIVSRQVPFIHPEKLTGSIRYMAPEQTGRMARLLDERSDIYSLGICFYELLCGKSPYEEAIDLAGWIHRHIAYPIIPITNFLNDIPTSLAELIHICLNKQNEDRYQSAFGLYKDLELIFDQPDLKLRKFDLSNEFHLSDKLYGRDKELELLRASIKEMQLAQSQVQFHLISGPSGIGKTRLVNQLLKDLSLTDGQYYSCKFDQYSNARPYSGIATAMEKIVLDLFSLDSTQLDQWRQKLRLALTSKAKILLQYLPKVHEFLGEFPPLPNNMEQSLYDAELKLQFTAFFQVMASSKRPILLFIDDLQWADTGSLIILHKILADTKITGLMIIGAYRSNEITQTHSFNGFLQKIKKDGIVWNDTTIAPLDLNCIQELLSDSTLRPKESKEIAIFSDFLLNRTSGNPFFIAQILQSLYFDKMLNINHEKRFWDWNMDSVLQSGITQDVVELLLIKLDNLNDQTIELLKIAACAGGQFYIEIINLITKFNDPDTLLIDAQKMGFIIELKEHSGHYKFIHDKVQEALYRKTTNEYRENTHYLIATHLIKNRDKYTDINDLDIAEHFRLSPSIVLNKKQSEGENIFQLLVKSAQIAKSAFAWDKSIQFLDLALRIYEKFYGDWGDVDVFSMYYCLCSSLLNLKQEESYKKIEKMYQKDDKLTGLQKIDLKATYIKYLSEIGNFRDCIIIGSQVLESNYLIKLGDCSKDMPISKTFIITLTQVKNTKKTTSNIIATMNSPEQREDVIFGQISKAVCSALYFQGQKNRLIYLALTSYKYCINKNILNYFIFIRAMHIFVKFKEYKIINAWVPTIDNNLSKSINESNPFYYLHRGIYYPLILNFSLNYIIESFKICQEIGPKFEDGTYTDLAYMWELFAITEHSIQNSTDAIINNALNILKKRTSSLCIAGAVSSGLLYHRFAKEFTYIYPNQEMFERPFSEEDTLNGGLTQKYLSIYCSLNWYLCIHDWKKAYELYIVAQNYHEGGDGWFTDTFYYISYVILHFRLKLFSPAKLYQSYIYLKRVFRYSETNWGHFYLLFKAECSQFIKKDYPKAEKQYLQAIESAKKAGFLRLVALIYDLLTLMIKDNGARYTAYLYAKEAVHAWNEYGAYNKAKITKNELFKDLFDEFEIKIAQSSNEIISSKPIKSDLQEVFDIKAIQSTIKILTDYNSLSDILLKTLESLIEFSQAELAIIIIKDFVEGKCYIEGHCDIKGLKKTLQHEKWEENPSLPFSLIRPIINGQNKIDVGSSDSKKSYLCLPILKSGNLQAIIYLENQKIHNCFTQNILETVKILSYTLYFSIENAFAYKHLDTRVALNTKELQRKNQSINAIFSNIQVGVFTFGEDKKCRPEYSNYLKEIIGMEQLSGLNS